MSTKFRYDISFLRAVSVIAVILYHFNFSYFKGGFVGVDIFFVISGYLMTRIILLGFSQYNFSLITFYNRRIIRIFPALLAMIIFFSIIIFFFLPTQFIVYLKSAYSSILFFSNIYYFLKSGYFESSSHFNFLLHTWSLSVEWQFYIIYPLILLLLKKKYLNNKFVFKIVFYFLIILSFLSMLFHDINDNSFSFYIFYTRAWEMMLGGGAFLNESRMNKISKNIKTLLIILFLIIILYFIYTNEFRNNWPSAFTIIPVLSTAIIISININLRFFKTKIIKYIGDLSYSLYLYHWPIYVFSLFFGFNERIRYKLFFIALSIFFSILSFHFVEKLKYEKKTKCLVCSSIVLFCLSLILSKADANIFYNNIGNLINITARYKNSDEAIDQYKLGTNHLLYSQKFNEFNQENLLLKDSDKFNVILLGDSHAGMFSKTINYILKNNGIKFIQITADATYPMINSDSDYKGPIELFNYFFTSYFPKNHEKIQLVIINSSYASYPKDELIKRINFTETYFKKYNTKIIYLGQTDLYILDFPTFYYIKKFYNLKYKLQENNNQYQIEINDYLKNRLNDRYIDLMNVEITKISSNSIPYIYDSNHLTFYGTEQYKSVIESKILEIIK